LTQKQSPQAGLRAENLVANQGFEPRTCGL
jgi:hypothetical protein